MSRSVEVFFDKATFTLTYVIFDDKSRDAIIIDPVLDYDPASSTISCESMEKVIDFIKKNSLTLHYVLETHAHADHLSAAAQIKKLFPGIKIGIGQHITKVQETFAKIFNLKNFKTDGSQFDILLSEEKPLSAGTIAVKTIFTPGHTPACSSYLIDDMVFTGDALFMPDYGTGRCDFPFGSAQDLYHSIHEKLYKLPDSTRYFTGHDYQPGGRQLLFESTIEESKKNNIQLKETTTKKQFVEFRTKRDAALSAPRLLLPSIQININAGYFYEPEDNGVKYLKFPIKFKE